MVGGLEMKKNKKLVTGALLIMTVVLLVATFYISALLSSPNKSPTQIRKTKASAVTYKKEINLVDNFGSGDGTPTVTPKPKPTLLVLAPTHIPTDVPSSKTPTKEPIKEPTKAPTKAPTTAPVILAQEPTDIPEPTKPAPTPTLQPLLAYKSTSISPTPTLIPVKNTGGMSNPTPTKKLQPTGVQTLPETGWIQTSSILFIVAMTTIFFSLLF